MPAGSVSPGPAVAGDPQRLVRGLLTGVGVRIFVRWTAPRTTTGSPSPISWPVATVSTTSTPPSPRVAVAP